MKKQLVLLVLTLASCGRVVKQDFKTLDFDLFKISVPSTWEAIELKGIDSYVSAIRTANGDTISFDIGAYSSDLTKEVQIRDFDRKRLYDSLGVKFEGMLFSATPELDMVQGIYLKEYYKFDSIDCYKARLIIPKEKGNGITGIYIDSLNKDGKKMNLYGIDLDSLEQEQLIASFKTVKIKFCP